MILINDSTITVDITPGITSNHRLKLRITSPTNNTDTYDISSTPITVPLKYGSGRYTVALYEHVYGNKYRTVWVKYFDVKIEDPDSCFLKPNVYVDYEGTGVEDIVKEVCAGKNELESYHAVCEYVKTHFAYDFVRAVTVRSGCLPDIKRTLEKRMGICQDLAALTVALLRGANILSKLVIGHADGKAHAWTESVVNGERKMFDPTVAVSGMREPRTYTSERVY